MTTQLVLTLMRWRDEAWVRQDIKRQVSQEMWDEYRREIAADVVEFCARCCIAGGMLWLLIERIAEVGLW